MRPGLGNVLRFPCPRSGKAEDIAEQMCSVSGGWQLEHLATPQSAGCAAACALDLSARGKGLSCWLAAKNEEGGGQKIRSSFWPSVPPPFLLLIVWKILPREEWLEMLPFEKLTCVLTSVCVEGGQGAREGLHEN